MCKVNTLQMDTDNKNNCNKQQQQPEQQPKQQQNIHTHSSEENAYCKTISETNTKKT